MMTSIRLGLGQPSKKQGNSAPLSRSKPKAVFGDDDSDNESGPATTKHGAEEITTFDDEDPVPLVEQTNTGSTKTTVPPSKPSLNPSKTANQFHSLSSVRSTAQATSNVDSSIYDYDSFHAASTAAQKARKEEAAKKSNNGHDYMNDLMAAAEQRKKDQLKAKDRLLQKEREEEGDEFEDKDMFVTDAYKAQQAEMRKAEEEEKKKEEEAERKKRAAGMSGFHRSMMAEQDKKHQEVLDAEKKLRESGAAIPEDEETQKEKSEAELASELAERGKAVELNEEGQIADKRELLGGGLNVVAKPKPPTSQKSDRERASSPRDDGKAPVSRANWDAKRAQRDRQSRMLEMQMEQAAKRKAEEDAGEVQKRERAAKSQKTSTDISSAKERYLQRKREAAAEKARGEG